MLFIFPKNYAIFEIFEKNLNKPMKTEINYFDENF